MTEQADILLDGEGVIAYIDIDDFKTINDTRGHAFGDDVINELTRLGKEFVPEDATFTDEYDQGDEFLILLPGYDKAASEEVLEDFRTHVLDSEPNGIEASVSIGVAEIPTDAATSKQAKHRAEEAMRRAKAWGGNQVQVYGEFEPLETIDVMFDLQAAPGRPDDRMVIEMWREGAQTDLRAEVIRNENGRTVRK